MWRQVITSILVGAFMFSMGFGSSQLAIVAEVKRNSVRIDTLELSAKELKLADTETRAMVDAHIGRVAGVIEKLVEQNTALILKLNNGKVN